MKNRGSIRSNQETGKFWGGSFFSPVSASGQTSTLDFIIYKKEYAADVVISPQEIRTIRLLCLLASYLYQCWITSSLQVFHLIFSLTLDIDGGKDLCYNYQFSPLFLSKITGADLGGRKVRRCVPMEILIIDILKLWLTICIFQLYLVLHKIY